MNNFPSIEPIYAITKDSSPLKGKTQLGDGYQKRVSFGLNTIKPVWSVEWAVSPEDASTINLFLKDRAMDGEWFYWAPPDSDVPLKWRCDEWTANNQATRFVRINASFRQVLEMETIEIERAAAVCAEDFCGGSGEGGGGGGGGGEEGGGGLPSGGTSSNYLGTGLQLSFTAQTITVSTMTSIRKEAYFCASGGKIGGDLDTPSDTVVENCVSVTVTGGSELSGTQKCSATTTLNLSPLPTNVTMTFTKSNGTVLEFIRAGAAGVGISDAGYGQALNSVYLVGVTGSISGTLYTAATPSSVSAWDANPPTPTP